jgi:hypothetical protein
MLLPDPLIRNRHLPPGKRHDLPPKGKMLLVERGAPEAVHDPAGY